ncbi:MAG: hypothetical protein U0359_39065 [Byssovorax sp.]
MHHRLLPHLALLTGMLLACGPTSSGSGTTGTTTTTSSTTSSTSSTTSGAGGGTTSTAGTGGAGGSSTTGAGGSGGAATTTGAGGSGGAGTTTTTAGSGGAGGAGTTTTTAGSGGAGGAGTTTTTAGSGGAGGAGGGGAGGTVLWTKVFPQAPGWMVPLTNRSVAVDGAGNIVIAGGFTGAMDFGALHLVAFIHGTGYVARFDATGNPLWAKLVTGDVEGGRASATVNAAGEVLVNATGTSNFGTNYAHIIALDPAGNQLWKKDYSSAVDYGFSDGYGIDDQGRVSLSGSVGGGSVNFGGGAIGPNKTFFLAFDAAGAFLWQKLPGYPLSVDASGDMAVSSPSASFGCGPASAQVARLDATGGCLWAKAFAGMVPSKLRVVASPSGDMLVVAPYTGLVDFGCGPVSSATTALAVTQLSAAGICQWTKSFTGQGFALNGVPAFGASPTGAGQWIVWAGFTGQIDFGQGPLTSQNALATMAIAKLDSAGASTWSTLVHGGVSDTQLAGTPSGGVILASSADGIDLGQGNLLPGGSGIVLASLAP